MQQGILDINRASASEFDSLPGIGPTLAERVVQLRKQKGRFDSVEDLLEVKGIGPSKLGRLRPFAAVRNLGGESPGE
jgi:competence protein ComEA